MKYFTDDYVMFFKELAANNNKEWFDKNRKRYESSVKKPFQQFTQAVIDRMFAKNPNDKIEPKDAILRINRDIRFSQDKTPYKTMMSAVVSPAGKKDKTTPGLYFELGPDKVGIYGGAYILEKDQLQQVREYIAANAKAFEKAINDPGFRKYYGEILGEKNKKLSPEFKEAAEKQPLIYNKSFYYFAKLDPKLITGDKLLDTVMDYYDKSAPVFDFLTKALKS